MYIDGVDDCYYEFQVATKWACPGEVPPETEDNSLSGGSIFVIILISGFFAYFVFGWITCAFLNRKDRGCTDICGNVPHATFWIKLPSLVCAGCCFTKDFLFGLCSKDGGSSTNTNAQIKGNGAAYETIDD